MKKIILIFACFSFFSSCDCFNYYVNEKEEKILKTDFFNIMCYMRDSGPDGMSLVVQKINTKNIKSSLIKNENVKLQPIIANDTLILKNILYNDYVYEIKNEKSIENLKIMVSYDAIKNNKKIKIQKVYNLNKREDCRFSLRMH